MNVSPSDRSLSWRIAISLFFLNSFFLVSRILDPLGKRFRILAVLLVLFGIALIASRRVLVAWKPTAGKILPFLAGWFGLTYALTQRLEPNLYLQNMIQGCLLFVAAAALLTNVNDFKKLFAILAAAGLAACALGFAWHTTLNGRFALRAGPYADANYYAMCLLIVTPVIWVVFAQKAVWLRICGGIATSIPLLLALRTLSRGGLVAMVMMVVVILCFCSIGIRILVASLAAVSVVVLLAFLPPDLQTRLASVVRLANSTGMGPHDNSAVARQTLLVTSLALTIHNPVFGVGPGNFGPTVVEIGRSQGFDWVPLNTHNAYTQISSETGIPGLLLFLAFIFFCLKDLVSLIRQTSTRGPTPDSELHLLAVGLLVSLTAMLTCMFFLSEAYNLMLFFWLGLACGLKAIAPVPTRALKDPDLDLDSTERFRPNIAS